MKGEKGRGAGLAQEPPAAKAAARLMMPHIETSPSHTHLLEADTIQRNFLKPFLSFEQTVSQCRAGAGYFQKQ